MVAGCGRRIQCGYTRPLMSAGSEAAVNRLFTALRDRGNASVQVGEPFQTQLHPKREIDWDGSHGGDCLWMPFHFHCLLVCDSLIIRRLLCCFPAIVPKPAGFVLWNRRCIRS